MSTITNEVSCPVDVKNERERFSYLSKISEKAERYDDMAQNMKKVVELDGNLTVEERNQLSVAYKNIIGARRAAWRVISNLEGKIVEKEKDPCFNLIVQYRKTIEKELDDICKDILDMLDNQLLSNQANVGESRVFYLKMKGDYHRYIAEFATGNDHHEAADTASAAYSRAMEHAALELPPTHPIRLGLALNYSVFHYEIRNSPDKACRLAKHAFDDAIAELDTLSEESYKDSTLIMQLLRDNLTLWTTDAGADEKHQGEKPAEQTEAH